MKWIEINWIIELNWIARLRLNWIELNCGCNSIQSIATARNSIQSIATGCNSIQISIELPIATGCNSIESIATLNCRLRMAQGRACTLCWLLACLWSRGALEGCVCHLGLLRMHDSECESGFRRWRRISTEVVIGTQMYRGPAAARSRDNSLRWDSQRSSSGRGARACRVACQWLGSLCLLCLEKNTKGIKWKFGFVMFCF